MTKLRVASRNFANGPKYNKIFVFNLVNFQDSKSGGFMLEFPSLHVLSNIELV
jgi:hypothetical protein